MSNAEEGRLRRFSLSVHEIHDRSLILTYYSCVRFGHEVFYCRRVPVIPTSYSPPIIQTLLHDCPLAIRRHDETVQVDLKSIGNRIVVDASGESTGADQGFAVEPATFCNRSQFLRRVPREPATTSADIDPEFVRSWAEAALEGAHDCCGDAGRVRIYCYQLAECLELERIA